jgi:peptidoglycan/LPS O-acetylase OafA/YrhL
LDVFYGHAIVNFDFSGFAHNKSIISVVVVIFNTIFEFFKGVPLFYCMSGFLIWDSIERSNTFREYARKRIFRVYPELWGAVVASLISIIVIYREKIIWLKLALFGITQGTVLQFWTPDFLRGYGNGTPNGALWTICVIVQFYVVCWFIHKVLKGKSLWTWCTVLICSIIVGWASPILESKLPTIVYKLYSQTVIPYVWLFLVGCFMAEFYDQIIPTLKKYWWMVLLISVIWIFLVPFDISIGLYSLMGSLLCCAACFGFAYAFPRLNLRTDISYGIYLYHMVVINIFVQLGLTDNFGYFIGAAVIIFICAFISTKTIGRMGLKLKTKAKIE